MPEHKHTTARLGPAQIARLNALRIPPVPGDRIPPFSATLRKAVDIGLDILEQRRSCEQSGEAQ